MATIPVQNDPLLEDDYIDMDLSSANFLSYTVSCPSPQHLLEFEFQMGSNKLEKQTLTSHADDLFYNGKLLPLHFEPKLVMEDDARHGSQHFEKTIVITTPNTMTANNTPFESCNVSPSTSCYVSGELNPDYFQQCYAELLESQPKKSWSKKLKIIKQFAISSKLKASKAFIKSFFNKPVSSNEKCRAFETKYVVESSINAATKKKPFGQICIDRKSTASHINQSSNMKSNTVMDKECHRRSFSGALKWQSSSTHSSSTSGTFSHSSSFSSKNSNDFHKFPTSTKRSCMESSDNESSVEGAIAYCKKSQQLLSA